MLKLHPKKHSYKLFYFFIWQYQFVEEMQPFLNRCPQIHGCYIIKTGKGCTSLFRLNTCTGTTKSIVEHRQFSKWGKKFYRFFFQSKHTSYIGGKVHVEFNRLNHSVNFIYYIPVYLRTIIMQSTPVLHQLISNFKVHNKVHASFPLYLRGETLSSLLLGR